MKISKILYVAILILTTSCVETVVMGFVGGGVLVTREKTLQDTRSDVVIAATLTANFITHGLKNPGNSINFTVNEGRILLTGIVRDSDKTKLAQEVSWNVVGVKEVIDEIQIRDDSLHVKDFSSAAYDYFLTTEAEAKLLFSPDINWPNYKITTVDGTLYLLGVSANDFEMQRTLSVVSKIRGVEKVVNHVLLRDDPRRHG